MDECFHHIKNLPALPQKYIDEAIAADYHFKINNWTADSNAWRGESTFNQTDFFKILEKRFTLGVCYLKNGPREGYEWHTDRKRTCVINFLLTKNEPAFVLFRKKINAFFFDIVGQVPYEIGQPFLFNAQIEHSVFNLSDSDRLIMSIGFIGPTYEEVKDFLLKLPAFDKNYNFNR